jgi:RNA polymerase sigma factor (sigma-70 family)
MSAPERACESLYEAHASELRRFARRRVGREEADDVVQDVYLHLLQEGDSSTLESPRAYLFRIATNLTIDARRKVEVRSRFATEIVGLFCPETMTASPEAVIAGFMELQKFRACLAELPPLRRKIFLLDCIDDLTHAEIANRLGVSVRTVERHLVKARNYLSLRCGR